MSLQYLITSREGLYYLSCNLQDKQYTHTKLRDGFFFGLTFHKTTETWYTFRYDTKDKKDKNKQTNQGVIESFQLSKEYPQTIINLKQQLTNLDNGVHQIIIYNNLLYVLETYIQCVKIYTINEDTSLTLLREVYLGKTTVPIVNAHYKVANPTNETTCDNYYHANAITIQDNYIYLSCPSLRNTILNNTPHQNLSNHIIRVYDIDFNYLWHYTLPNEYFCHDLVFTGHIINLTSPPNKIIQYDIVNRSITPIIISTITDLPRGLSITHPSTLAIGSRKDRTITILQPGSSPIIIPMNIEPCCIASISHDEDYYYCDNQLRIPCVFQESFETNPVYNLIKEDLYKLKDTIFNIDISPTTKLTANKQFRKYTKEEYDLQDIIDPPQTLFTNIKNWQKTISPKYAIEDFLSHTQLQNQLDNIIKIITKKTSARVSGKGFIYLPNHHLGWHTNLEVQSNHNAIRYYIIFTTQQNSNNPPESFFLYRHPNSHQIHAIPDRNSYANIFNLGTPDKPLWHAVINVSKDIKRFSLGLAYYDKLQVR